MLFNVLFHLLFGSVSKNGTPIEVLKIKWKIIFSELANISFLKHLYFFPCDIWRVSLGYHQDKSLHLVKTLGMDFMYIIA
jgi:hypothetical protein